ncbi:RREB1 (predicted) [Pycnogonum litorale]
MLITTGNNTVSCEDDEQSLRKFSRRYHLEFLPKSSCDRSLEKSLASSTLTSTFDNSMQLIDIGEERNMYQNEDEMSIGASADDEKQTAEDASSLQIKTNEEFGLLKRKRFYECKNIKQIGLNDVYTCPVCNLSLSNQHDFTVHIRQHKSAIEDGSVQCYSCGICNKVLSSASSLDRHMLVHSGERPFKCKYCNMAFTTNGNMHRHMRTHAGHPKKACDDTKAHKSKILNKKHKSELERNGKHRKDDMTVHVMSESKNDNEPECPNTVSSPINLSTQESDKPPRLDTGKLNRQENEASEDQRKLKTFRDLSFVDFTVPKFPLIAKAYCESNIPLVDETVQQFRCHKCKNVFPCKSALNIHLQTTCSDTSKFTSKTEETSNSYVSMLNPNLCGSKSPTSNKNSFNLLTGYLNEGKKNFLALFELRNKMNVEQMNANSSDSTSDDEPKNLLQSIFQQKCNPDVSMSSDFADIQSILTMTSQSKLMDFVETSNIVSSLDERKVESPIQPYSTVPQDPMSKSRGTPETDQDDSSRNEQVKSPVSDETSDKINTAKPFMCDQCDLKFKSVHSLRRHNRLHHQNWSIFCCQICNYTSGDKSTLIRHLRTHNGERPFQCSLCKYAFTTKANCERHIRKRHGRYNKQEIVESMECNNEPSKVSSPFNESTNAHDKVTSDIKADVTTCKICNVDLKYNRILRHHMKSVHHQQPEKPFACKLCNHEFSTKNNCYRHVLNCHSNNKADINDELVEKACSTSISNSGSDSDISMKSSFHSVSFDSSVLQKSNITKSRLTDDELSSIEAIVNLANLDIKLPAEQPLDLAVHALDLSVKNEANSASTDGKGHLSSFSQTECNRKDFRTSECIENTLDSFPIKILSTDLESSLSSTENDIAVLTADTKETLRRAIVSKLQHKLSVDKALDLSIKRTSEHVKNSCKIGNEVADSNIGDLASISQLLKVSRQALSLYFDNEAESKDKSTYKTPADIKNPENQMAKTLLNRFDDNFRQSKKRISSYSNSPNSVICPFCNRRFPWSSSLRRHILTHTGQKPYKCPKCPLWFTTKSNCERHLYRKHETKRQRVITADAALRSEPNKYDTDRSTLKCDFCSSRIFSNPVNFVRHCVVRHGLTATTKCED